MPTLIKISSDGEPVDIEGTHPEALRRILDVLRSLKSLAKINDRTEDFIRFSYAFDITIRELERRGEEPT